MEINHLDMALLLVTEICMIIADLSCGLVKFSSIMLGCVCLIRSMFNVILYVYWYGKEKGL